MSTTNIAPAAMTSVLDALRDVHDEASLWKLSDELAVVAPSGVEAVEKVVAEAKKQGIPTKSANTLRLYRDVALRFPKAERIAGVSFSAHREAIAIGDVKKARKVLEELVKQHGAAGVTVTTVKKAIGVVSGKPAAAPKSSTSPVHATSYEDVAIDLAAGGKRFMHELDAMLALSAKGVTLDSLHAGLSAVLVELEARRAKAARKRVQADAAASKAASKVLGRPVATPKKAAPAKPRPAAKPTGQKAGDLRGL